MIIKTFFILLIVLYIINVRQIIADDNGLQYEFHIVDALPDNKIPLEFHCASKDDELGYHKPKVGDDFHWRFRINAIESTLFFCHFWWGKKQRAFEVFNRHLVKYCSGDFPTHFCYWKVQADGFYLGETLSQLQKWYDWS